MKRRAATRLTGAFTLIELLVVVSIIATLTISGLFFGVNGIRNAAMSRAASDLQALYSALAKLEADTAHHIPQGQGADTNTYPPDCIEDEEVNLNTCRGGLIGILQDGTRCDALPPGHPDYVDYDVLFPGWRGPYIDVGATIDPWGTPYQFDPDYACHDYVRGCEHLDYTAGNTGVGNLDGDTENYHNVRALRSSGQDRQWCYREGGGCGVTLRDQDNVVLVLCEEGDF